MVLGPKIQLTLLAQTIPTGLLKHLPSLCLQIPRATPTNLVFVLGPRQLATKHRPTACPAMRMDTLLVTVLPVTGLLGRVRLKQ